MVNNKSVEAIYQEMHDSLFPAGEKHDATLEAICNKVFQQSCDFLERNHFVNKMGVGSGVVVSMEDFSEDAQVEGTDGREIEELVAAADIPEDSKEAAAEQVAVLLAKMKAAAGNNSLYMHKHFAKGAQTNQNIAKTMSTVYAPSLQTMANSIGMPAMEAFGANIDKVLPDVRASLAVTLLQFHRGLLDRIIHRHASASPYVKYVVPYAEVYDMLKSNDADHNVRDNGEHIVPFVELYNDPRVVSNTLQPIVPLTANDTEGCVFADGYLRPNVEANLFDLSTLAGQVGASHYNYTDLVSENVVLNSIVVKVTKGDVSELFEVNVHELNGARLQMVANANDSGMRQCELVYTGLFTAKSTTLTGEKTKIFAECTDDDVIRYALTFSAGINLKRSDVHGYGFVNFRAHNRAQNAVAKEIADLAAACTMSIEAYSIDACYSEENLRKSNLAIRSHVRTFDFEISNGRNILIDYAFDEDMPEYLMSLVTEATSLGQDHRGIDVIVRELLHVYDVTREETMDPTFRQRLDRVGFQYVAAQMVRPCVYLNTIDLANVDTIRSSDVLGDIRQYVEYELINLTSLLFQNSFYKHQLSAGEKPVFKLFTSAVVLDNLFNVPHIHNHLDTKEAVDGTGVEYRRVLPNGTILDCVTVTYGYMRDKIVMIPWRENNPDDVLNFGHNWDFGTFVAHYNPQLDNAANKRVFANTRSMVIPTNPMGLYLDVRGLNEFIDMFQVQGNVTSKLPQPSDIIAAE